MEYASGNVYIRPNNLRKAGDLINGHTHNFDHTTFFIRGRCRVTISAPVMDAYGDYVLDDKGEKLYVLEMVKEFAPGGHLLIKAEKMHKIEALDDDVLFHCVYSHRTPQGDIEQDFCGWREAYV